jgi:hypothetical protein
VGSIPFSRTIKGEMVFSGRKLQRFVRMIDLQIAKSVPEYSGHAGSESRYADQYFSLLGD